MRLVTSHYAGRAPEDSIVATLTALKSAPASLGIAILDGLASGWPEGKGPRLNEADRAMLMDLMTLSLKYPCLDFILPHSTSARKAGSMKHWWKKLFC